MFYLIRGSMEVQELGKGIGPGSLIGEIGVFASNRTRMATVVCRTDCEVYELTASKAKELYYQNPHSATLSSKSSLAGSLRT